MTKAEFVDMCTKCGYASRRTTQQYSADRDIFSDDDFIAVYRLNELRLDIKNGLHDKRFRDYEGARSTKRLITLGSDEG